MIALSRRLTLFALLPAALTACQPKAVETPVAEPAAETLAGVPLCGDLGEADFGPMGTADCRLAATDASGWTADVSYVPVDDYSTTVTLAIATADGMAVQTITETAESAYGLPEFKDLDNDGRAEILVPLLTGNVNTNYAVWRGEEGEPTYVRAGEIHGIDMGPLEDGLFASSARGSAATWYASYYVFDGATLVPVATAMSTLNDGGETQECVVSDDGGLASIDMTLAAAQEKFCHAD